MQAILSTLIVMIAALYVANQWMPHKLKQRVMQAFGKTITKSSYGVCGSCSSGACSSSRNCGNNANVTHAFKKISIIRPK